MAMSELGRGRHDGLVRMVIAGGIDLARLGRNGGDRFWEHLIVNVLDPLLWGGSGDGDPDSFRWIMVSSTAILAVESGFRSVSDPASVPPVDCAPLLPGRRGGPLVEAAVRLSLPTVAPTLAANLARRAHHRRLATSQWVAYGAFATLGGVVLGLVRNRLHREAAEDWTIRGSDALLRYANVARSDAARMAADAHAFMKCLLWLSAEGSREAAAALDNQMRWPASRAAGERGKPLGLGLVGVRIEPGWAATIWLPDELLDDLNAFVDDAELEPRSDDATLRLTRWDGRQMEVTQWGYAKSITLPVPGLERSLDPFPAVIFLGAVWKLTSLVPGMGAAPASLVLLAVAVDIAVSGRGGRRRAGLLDPDRRAVCTTVAASLALAIGTALGESDARSSAGVPVFPATAQMGGAMALVGAYWSGLGPVRWTLASALVATSWWAAVRPGDRTLPELLGEVAGCLTIVAVTVGFGTRVAEEADVVERAQQRSFAAGISAGRRAAHEEEVRHYRDQLDLAQREYERLRGAVDPDLGSWFEERCREVGAWLDSRASP